MNREGEKKRKERKKKSKAGKNKKGTRRAWRRGLLPSGVRGRREEEGGPSPSRRSVPLVVLLDEAVRGMREAGPP